MKHLLIGVAAVAALAISAPARSQPAPSTTLPGTNVPAPTAPSALPSQMNRMPTGGRATSNRGMGTATGATTGVNTPAGAVGAGAYPSSIHRMPAGGRATSERGSTGSVVHAHHRRHAAQSAKNTSAGGQADQLNRQELSQLQATNPTTMNRMSVGGKATSGGTNQ